MPIDAISAALNPALSRAQDLDPTAAASFIPDSQPITAGSEATGKTFGQMLQDAIGEVSQTQNHAADLTRRFAAGEPIDIHTLEIAGQEANVMLSLTVQVRNKLQDAYTEIMRVNV